MSIYTGVLTVPAGTPQNSPATVEVSINEWTIIRFDIFFPPGCSGLVHIAVYYGSEQIAPKPTGSGLAGDAETISWPEEWKCPEKPCRLRIVGWSPSAQYDHKIYVRIVTRPESLERAEKRRRLSEKLIIRFLKRIIGVKE